MALNVFELFAKLGFDSSDFDKGVEEAAAGFEDLGDSASGVSADTAKAEKAIDKLADAVAEATDDTHGMSDAAQANSNKVKVLASRHEQAKEKVEKLRKELNESAEKTGTASDETMVLADKLAKAEKECNEYADALRDVQDALDGAGKSSGSTSLLDSIAGGVLKGNLMTNAASAVVNGVKQLASAVWNMDEATEEYRIAQGKLNTAFQAAGYSVTAAQKTFKQFYAILGDVDTATEASQLLARLSTGQEDLARWTEIAAGVYGTFGDSLPIEGLIEASNETAKVGQVTGVLADALNWVGISEDDFNVQLSQCANTTERTALITETLTGKYRDAAATFNETNSTLIRARESQLRLQDAQAKVGEQSSRLKTALSGALAPAMEDIYSLTEKIVSACADWAESWERFVKKQSEPLETDNIEEARAQIEAWKSEIVETEKALAIFYSPEVGAHLAELYANVENGTTQLQEMEDTAAGMAESGTETADAIDKMTVSANGFSVELINSSMTIEEATERLNTYTSAATNMFSQINTESELSYQQAIENMQHNVEATQAFGDNMAQIAGVLPAELADMFAAGGPEMYAGIVAMLAEANSGADVGLTELVKLYEEGGLAATEAFLKASGQLPADAETPATKVAEAMDNDVSCEQAGADVIDRTADAMITRVSTAGFDSAGRIAMQRFIAGMNERRSAVEAAAKAIADAAKNTINASLAGIGTGGYTGRYSAGGLDYVPYDGYPAILHRREAVLTADEADAWRAGKTPGGNTSGITIIQNIESVPQTPVELAAATAAYFEQARWVL